MLPLLFQPDCSYGPKLSTLPQPASLQGQAHRKGAACPWLAFHPDTSPAQFHDPLDD